MLGDEDPPYRGIRIPLRFWKIATWVGGDGLAAAGFVLDQAELVDTRDGMLTSPPLGAFRTFQVPVADIAAMTGLDLGILSDADVLSAPAARGEGWRMLQTPADVVLTPPD